MSKSKKPVVFRVVVVTVLINGIPMQTTLPTTNLDTIMDIISKVPKEMQYLPDD